MVRSGVANSLIFDDEPGTTLIIRKFIEGIENEQLQHWSWTALTLEKHIDFILAVGGNLVIDCCKVAATQAALEDIWDMELVQYQLHIVSPILMGWWSHLLRYKGRDDHLRWGEKVKTSIPAAAS